MKSFSCETGRLQLRPLAKGDEALFHALYSDPETMRFIGDPWSPMKVAKRFQKLVNHQEQPKLDDRYLVIVRKNGQTSMGICGTSHYDLAAMRLEVGIMLLRRGRGLGIAREALTALLGRAFEDPLVEEVYARFTAENIAIRNLMMRVGFHPCGLAKGGGAAVTMREWSIHRSRWCISNSTTSQG
ncbi:MAG TPA: GNAT family N-acetyltransferase [Rhodanobacter sp.]|nr:GNAT family N-acetyltransferase [Rhodanobacter sp.]